ncbi:hypothetical protein J6590_015499 [Homalodisca vitripennis]|nr:hypothetical protein J6590_015499 [Homalodisca vitripennis]
MNGFAIPHNQHTSTGGTSNGNDEVVAKNIALSRYCGSDRNENLQASSDRLVKLSTWYSWRNVAVLVGPRYTLSTNKRYLCGGCVYVLAAEMKAQQSL